MNETNSRRDLQVALGLLLGFLALYLATLCPTVYFGDSGEISSAIFQGGVIHPPGYPLFSLLGRLALIAVPWGEPAFRVGTLVALSAALTVPTLFLIQRQLRVGALAAAVAAAVFGASYTFWSQSVRVEVYSLHVLLCALALLFTLQYRESRSLLHLRLTCLALALGLAHHLTIVLLLPGLLVLVGKRFWVEPGLGKRLGAALPIFLLTFGLYTLIPLFWARDETLHNMGSPSTPMGLFNHATARMYRDNLGIHSVAQLSQSLTNAWNTARESLPLSAWLGAFIGGGLLARRDRIAFAGLSVAGLAVTLNALNYHILDISAYYLPVVLISTAFLGTALDALARRLASFGQGKLPLVLAAAPVALALANFPTCNLHRATLVREFARHKLESCDPRSVLIMQGDQDIYPIVYAQEALHVRPDVLTIGREYLIGAILCDWEPRRWYLHLLREKGVDVPPMNPENREEKIKLALDGYLIQILNGSIKNRPVQMTFFNVPKQANNATLPMTNLLEYMAKNYYDAPQGLVVRWRPKSEPASVLALAARGQAFWEGAALPDMSAIDTSQEMDPDYLPQHYVVMLANQGYLWERAGKPQNAAAIYKAMLEWQPERSAATLKGISPLAAEAVKRTQVAASR